MTHLVNAIKKCIPGVTYSLLGKIRGVFTTSVFTQNIDGYAKTVCHDVHELHGDIEFMKCEDCDIIYDFDVDIPLCPTCLNYCKPNIVLYGENAHIPNHLNKKINTVIVMGITM